MKLTFDGTISVFLLCLFIFGLGSPMCSSPKPETPPETSTVYVYNDSLVHLHQDSIHKLNSLVIHKALTIERLNLSLRDLSGELDSLKVANGRLRMEIMHCNDQKP